MLNKCYRQSRDKGKIRHNTQNKDKPTKKKNNKKLNRSDSSTDPIKNVGVNPGDGKVVVVSYKTFTKLLSLLKVLLLIEERNHDWDDERQHY